MAETRVKVYGYEPKARFDNAMVRIRVVVPKKKIAIHPDKSGRNQILLTFFRMVKNMFYKIELVNFFFSLNLQVYFVYV